MTTIVILTATHTLLHTRVACMINLIIVQATGDRSLSGVACLLRCCAGPSTCPVCVASSLYGPHSKAQYNSNNYYPLYSMFPAVSLWR